MGGGEVEMLPYASRALSRAGAKHVRVNAGRPGQVNSVAVLRGVSGAAAPAVEPKQFANVRDIQFNMYEVNGVDNMLERPMYEEHDRGTLDMVMSSAMTLAEDKFWPCA